MILQLILVAVYALICALMCVTNGADFPVVVLFSLLSACCTSFLSWCSCVADAFANRRCPSGAQWHRSPSPIAFATPSRGSEGAAPGFEAASSRSAPAALAGRRSSAGFARQRTHPSDECGPYIPAVTILGPVPGAGPPSCWRYDKPYTGVPSRRPP